VADFRSQRGALTALAVALLADGGRDATTVLAASRQRFLPLRDNGSCRFATTALVTHDLLMVARTAPAAVIAMEGAREAALRAR